ncbi:disease resistance protein PIK6-NP-like [Zingiber officinale]|uniref:Disease resistance protein RPM1-like n=1 Tax=Zingiber officinale TaxID=94328 RepID=A0A8J5HJ37_ZINOF|nr:disease resistance protein PIK6-NP-like [Zingiber officinale]KAG6528223.1 hypothetical protein ZIOFF_010374 [Zingiber officinale]
METAIATKVVDFAFNSMAGKLEKMLEEEAVLLAGVEEDVRYIVDELRSITSFLTVMSTRQNLDAQLQNWVQEVREVAYDAEDSIDEFDCRLRSTPYNDLGVKGIFKRFLHNIKSLKARHGIASEFKKLKVQIEEIRKRHDRYSHLYEADTGMAECSDPRIIGQFIEEAQLVGIKQSRDKIIGWVMDQNCPELTAISLVGFGGLGKTTLAKTVYDDLIIVGGHFQYRAWIVVSQNYSIIELLKKIIRQISVEEKRIRDVYGCQDRTVDTEQLLNKMDKSQLVETVRGHLHEKRYLIAFDDVWRTEAWENLSIALPPGKEGSRVIVTTRNDEVANYSCSRNRQFIFKVYPLSSELSWELFRRKVFDAPDYSCPPELDNVGREIVQKCSGIPLAIVTVGGLLASKSDKKFEEWKDFGNYFRSEIQTNNRLLKINQILLLSYNDLPYHLKPCFLFLGIFPEDYEIGRKRLMRRWIAEGIVSGLGGFPAEKVAERCFNELVSRSLVQPSEFNDNGKVKSCRVHDMMLEVIISISNKVNFAVLLNEHTTNLPQHQKIRRLSWHGGSSGLSTNTDLSHLRSFTAFGSDGRDVPVPLKDYRKQRLLRAIELEGSFNLSDHLHPKSFSKLFLLKYLSLRDSGISTLPDSIGDLQNLQFLDIRGTYIEELPNSIVKLQKLVYLLGGLIVHKFTREYPNMYEEVPKYAYAGNSNPYETYREPYLFNFINYQSMSEYDKFTIDVSTSSVKLKFPKGIRELNGLRKLGMTYADDEQLLQEIGELVKLEKLAICFGEDDQVSGVLEGIRVLLSKLSGSLRSLTISHAKYGDLKRALDGVDSPPLLLCKLQIHANLGGLPAWFASLKQVVKITLYFTRLQLQDLQVLRNLHKLVHLVLGFRSFDNAAENLVFDRGGFTHLKFLEIQSNGVIFEEGALQSLEILKMSYFAHGYSVDGIDHLRGLKEVHIYNSTQGIVQMVENILSCHSNHPKCYSDACSIM